MTPLPFSLRPWLMGAAGWLMAAVPSAAVEQTYRVAPGAWSLEQFGADVAVLRSSVGTGRPDEVGLLLACSADDRRIRVSFPPTSAAQVAGHGGAGLALLAAIDPPKPRRGVVVRFKISDPATLVVVASKTGSPDPVTRLAGSLAESPQTVDLLISWGVAPVVLTRLDAYRLSMQGAAPDSSIVAHFIAACQRPTPQRTN